MSLDASTSSNKNSTALVGRDGTSLKPGLSKKVVVAAVLGNALEFYDFAAYAFFAVYIGQAFFPASTPFASLLLSLGAFGVGYVFRPLGGVLIGAFADRAGRRPAMLLTIVLITSGTVGLALTPSYSSIGLAAPVIVVLCRLVQGLAIGGEVGPASAFLIEIAPTDRRGLYGSSQAKGWRRWLRAPSALFSPCCLTRRTSPPGAGACRSCCRYCSCRWASTCAG